MIGEILGGVSALASLFGSLKSAEANRAADQQLARRKSELETWYDKEYNMNYMDTPEAQSTLQLLRQQATDQMKKVDQGNAIRGSSDEQRVATAGRVGENMANATTRLAGQGTYQKNMANRQYQMLKQNLDWQEAQNLQNKNAQWMNFMNNAATAGTGFAQAAGNDSFGQWDQSLKGIWQKGKMKKAAGLLSNPTTSAWIR